MNRAPEQGDLARRDTLLDELRALARDYSDHVAVRQRLASGLVDTLNRAQEQGDLARTDVLLDELRALARDHRDDAAVRKLLLALFPVGTLVSERPPHSSERTQFGHSAPTSGI